MTSRAAIVGRSRFEQLAALPLRVDSLELVRHELPVSSGFTRVTTEIVLRGEGSVGRGEDVTYDVEDHAALPPLDLRFVGTFAGFSAFLGGLDLFSAEPRREVSRTYRRWAFESAALDLALRQAGTSLGGVLALPYRPVHFVLSTRLDIRPWLALAPGLEYKLDPTADWDRDLMREMAASGRVRVLDFKAYYTGTPVDNPPDAELYRQVATTFPDAVLEDPGVTAETGAVLAPLATRLSWDAPIHSVADCEGLPWPPRHLNIKPSRFGSVEALLDCIAWAQSRDVEMYGGGQFELAYGRGQIQALASLFYADGPNDVAPVVYHDSAPRAGLPASPLALPADPVGFGWDGAGA
jgi:hypothetical protein